MLTTNCWLLTEKRKLDEAGETAEKRIFTPANIANPAEGPPLDPSKFIFDCSEGHVQEVAQKLASTLPEFESHIQVSSYCNLSF